MYQAKISCYQKAATAAEKQHRDQNEGRGNNLPKSRQTLAHKVRSIHASKNRNHWTSWWRSSSDTHLCQGERKTNGSSNFRATGHVCPDTSNAWLNYLCTNKLKRPPQLLLLPDVTNIVFMTAYNHTLTHTNNLSIREGVKRMTHLNMEIE